MTAHDTTTLDIVVEPNRIIFIDKKTKKIVVQVFLHIYKKKERKWKNQTE